MFQSNPKSIHNLTWKSVSTSDSELRQEFCKNIILSGGNTQFMGFPNRMKDEIVKLAPASAEINIIYPCNRETDVW